MDLANYHPQGYWDFVWCIVALTVPATTIVVWALLETLEGKMDYVHLICLSVAVSLMFEPLSMRFNMEGPERLGSFDYATMVATSSLLWLVGTGALLFVMFSMSRLLSTRFKRT